MGRIIPIAGKTKKSDYSQKLIDAAWIFTKCALWPFETFPSLEINYAKKQIQTILDSNNSRGTFTTYIQQVLLANRMFVAEPGSWIDIPSVWFHQAASGGFCSGIDLYQHVERKRQQTQEYLQGIRIVADFYWQYVNYPKVEILRKCFKQLLIEKEYSLFQVWSNAIHMFLISKYSA